MGLFGRKKKAAPVEVPEVPKPTLPAPPAANELGQRNWEEHRDWVLDQVEELYPFGMNVLDALGLSLCEDIESDVDLPGFDNAAIDGYAVISADTYNATETGPNVLAVVGDIAAGTIASEPLPPGTAMRVATGAPLPEGADTVVPLDLTDQDLEEVSIHAHVEQDRNIRRRGSDINEGDLLLRRGAVVDSRTVGLLAGIGIDKVMVRPRPRVVVIATGGELVDPGLPLNEPGSLYDSNSYMLAAAAKAAGAQVFRVGVVGDDPEELKRVITDQLVRADLIVTSGGISEGDVDSLHQAAPELGLVDFSAVAMHPGTQLGFGLIGEDKIPLLMVPGNPVSAFVSFEAFVRPAIRKLMGVEPYTRQPVRCMATHIMRSEPGIMQFARAEVSLDHSGVRTVELVGGASPHLLGSLQRSNALVLLDEGTEVVAAGQPVMAWMLTDD